MHVRTRRYIIYLVHLSFSVYLSIYLCLLVCCALSHRATGAFFDQSYVRTRRRLTDWLYVRTYVNDNLREGYCTTYICVIFKPDILYEHCSAGLVHPPGGHVLPTPFCKRIRRKMERSTVKKQMVLYSSCLFVCSSAHRHTDTLPVSRRLMYVSLFLLPFQSKVGIAVWKQTQPSPVQPPSLVYVAITSTLYYMAQRNTTFTTIG